MSMQNTFLYFLSMLVESIALSCCILAVFRDQKDLRKRDFILVPSVSLCLLIARSSYGGASPGFHLTQGFFLAPADNFPILLILLMGLLLLTSTLLNTQDGGRTFCGTMAAFSLYLLCHFCAVMPLVLLSCLPLAEDDPTYVIFRFGSYRHYFIRKWISLGVLPAILVLVQLAAILLSGVGLPMENTWRLPDGSLEAELFEALSQVFSSPLTAFAGCTGYLFLGIWLISGLCMWLAHFAGHKHSVRIVVGLYVLSILWVKVPGIHAFPITGLNHLLILHHNLGIPHRWLVTGITAALLALFLIGSVCFPSKRKLLGKSQKRRGVQAYYQRALFQKQNLMILCGVVLGMTVYKGLSGPELSSGQEWVYRLFSGHGTGSFHILAFLEMLLVNTAPLYLIAVFAEASVSEQSTFVSVRSNSRKEMFHGILRTVIKFIAIYPVLWFLAGLTGGLIFVDRMDLIAIQFLAECVAFKFLDILLQTLVMLFCYLLTRQITVGFLAILAGNFLCVIPQNWVHYLPLGLSGTVRVNWDSFGMGIPAWMAMMILIGCLAVTLSLLELLGSKNLLGR